MDGTSYENCCCICLKSTNDKLKSLLTTKLDTLVYTEMLEYCTGLRITELPTDLHTFANICSFCEFKLLSAYDFKKMTIESARILQTRATSKQVHCVDSETGDFLNISFLSVENEFELQEKTKSPTPKARMQEELENDEQLEASSTSDDDDVDEDDIDDDDENDDEESLSNTKGLAKTPLALRCDQCNAQFKSKNEFYRHRSRNHSARLCPTCGKLVSRENYKAHLHGHSDRPIVFACDQCERKFKSKNSLIKHMRLHVDDKRYECKYCGEKFMHWATRRYHVSREHTGERRHTCHLCDEKFYQSSHYYIHMRRHTGEMPFECSDCSKKFITGHALKLHSVTHTKERNHICEICNKTFGTRRSMRTHMKIHTGEKNYVCTVCSRAFTQNHVMKTHMKTHLKTHPDFVIPPPGTILSQKYLLQKGQEQEQQPQPESTDHNLLVI